MTVEEDKKLDTIFEGSFNYSNDLIKKIFEETKDREDIIPTGIYFFLFLHIISILTAAGWSEEELIDKIQSYSKFKKEKEIKE